MQFTTQLPSGKGAHRRLFATLFLLLPLFLFATDPPVSGTFVPENPANGDTISLEISCGTASNQATNVTGLHLVIGYSGFEVNSNSVLTVDAGSYWFGEVGAWEASTYVDHANHEIEVWLDRTEGDSVSGYGLVALVDGIGTVLEDVNKKGLSLFIKDVELEYATPALLVYPNPATDILNIKGSGSVEVLNLSGQTVLGSTTDESQIDISMLKPGMYMLRSSETAEAVRFIKR